MDTGFNKAMKQVEKRIAGLEKQLFLERQTMLAIIESGQEANDNLNNEENKLENLLEEDGGRSELQITKEDIFTLNQQLFINHEKQMAATFYAESIFETIKEPLLVLDGNLHVKTANTTFWKTFDISLIETKGRLVFGPGNNDWNIPVLRSALNDNLFKEINLTGLKIMHHFKGVGYKVLLINAR